VKYNKNDGCSTCGYDSSDAVSSAVVRDGIPIPENASPCSYIVLTEVPERCMQSDDIGFREVKTMYVLFQCIIKGSTLWTVGLEVRTEFDAAGNDAIIRLQAHVRGFVQETRPIHHTPT
jgi:hypothetical protein